MQVIARLGIISLLIATWLALVANPGFALAAEPTATVTIVGTGTVAVDGIEVSKSPLEVPVGSQVCVVQSVQYVAAGDRWVFTGWDGGRPEELCLTISGPGSYRTVFAREVLVLVRSALASQRRSMWVRPGVPLNLEVPATVAAGEDTRYSFLEWSEGETPFLPGNTIIPLAPVTAEVKWVKEFRVEVAGPQGASVYGTGWYAEGADAVIQVPALIDGPSAGQRSKFSRWENVGAPRILASIESPLASVKVAGPLKLNAVYQPQVYVQARTPVGVLKKEWVTVGGDVALETPAIIESVPDRDRYVFQKWSGMAGLVSPKISGTAEQPVTVEAVYEHQFKVSVAAPYGSSGAGWYKQGATAMVTVPSAEEKFFFLQDVFVGFAGYGKVPTMSLVVGEPVDLTALYQRGVNLKALALLGILPLAVAGLLVGDWRLRRRLGQGVLGPKRRNGE